MENLVCGDIYVLNEIPIIENIKTRLQKMGLKYVYQVYNHKLVLFYFIGYTEEGEAPKFYSILNIDIKDKIEKVNISMNTKGKKDIEILVGNWENIVENNKIISLDIIPTYSLEFIHKNLLENLVHSKDYRLLIKRVGIWDDHLEGNITRLDIFL